MFYRFPLDLDSDLCIEWSMLPRHLRELHERMRAAKDKGEHTPESRWLLRELTKAMAEWQRSRWPKR